MKTIEQIQRDIDDRKRRLEEAFEAARERRVVRIAREDLALLEELCTPQALSRPSGPTNAGEAHWDWIRC
jgi:hypothetical protein